MVTRKEVEHIAKLARLGLSEKEIEKYQKELSPILDYIEKLKEVDVSGTEPTSHPLKIENVIREDEARKEKEVEGEELAKMAPETKDNYIKVKSILK